MATKTPKAPAKPRVRAAASKQQAGSTPQVLPVNRWLIELGKLTEPLNMPVWKRRS